MVLETFTVVAESKEIQYIVYLRWYKIYLREDAEFHVEEGESTRGFPHKEHEKRTL